MTHEYAIEADGLRKRYGDTTVLDGLDLTHDAASLRRALIHCPEHAALCGLFIDILIQQ